VPILILGAVILQGDVRCESSNEFVFYVRIISSLESSTFALPKEIYSQSEHRQLRSAIFQLGNCNAEQRDLIQADDGSRLAFMSELDQSAISPDIRVVSAPPRIADITSQFRMTATAQ
jgi:hypothetical protein